MASSSLPSGLETDCKEKRQWEELRVMTPVRHPGEPEKHQPQLLQRQHGLIGWHSGYLGSVPTSTTN